MRFDVETDGKVAVHDITDEVTAHLPADPEGGVTVYCRHTTAAVVVNEDDPRLLDDIETFLSESIPAGDWRHDAIDDNAGAHLASMLFGRSVTVPTTDGTLDLGRWGSILLLECDGPRTRQVTVM